jgi:hypothetical protein
LSADYTFDLLETEVGSSAEGATRGDFLRRLVTGGGALLVGGTVLAEFAPSASAASAKLDVTILNAALSLENLGKTFYAEAQQNAKLTGQTAVFVKVVHKHEVAHAAFVASALGKDANLVPSFSFGERTSTQAHVQSFALNLEGLCTEALIGVAPLLRRETLAKAGTLLPVEAQHVAWISNILGDDPAPKPFNPGTTLPTVEKKISAYIVKTPVKKKTTSKKTTSKKS